MVFWNLDHYIVPNLLHLGHNSVHSHALTPELPFFWVFWGLRLTCSFQSGTAWDEAMLGVEQELVSHQVVHNNIPNQRFKNTANH